MGCDGSWSMVGIATERVRFQIYFEVKKWQDVLMDWKDVENERGIKEQEVGAGWWGWHERLITLLDRYSVKCLAAVCDGSSEVRGVVCA